MSSNIIKKNFQVWAWNGDGSRPAEEIPEGLEIISMNEGREYKVKHLFFHVT